MQGRRPVALITGAARRIGAATASYLHQQGFDLLLHYHHSAADAQALQQALETQRADSVTLLQADLCQLAQVQEIAQAAENTYGRLDLLVNNASSFYPTPLGQISESDWDQLVGSNLKAPLFLSQALTPLLAQSQGAIVNLVDIHADSPLAEHTVYCIAKAGLVMLTKSLARELAPQIRVNAIAPGAILWPEQALDETAKTRVVEQIALGRLGDASDIARTVYFLAQQAPYITGQILAVDGGRSL